MTLEQEVLNQLAQGRKNYAELSSALGEPDELALSRAIKNVNKQGLAGGKVRPDLTMEYYLTKAGARVVETA